MRKWLPTLLPLLSLLWVGFALAPREGRADPRGHGPLMDEPTRAAIDRGLRWLVRTQNADGSWTSDAGNKVNEEYIVAPGGKDVHHVGVTSLAILSFLAAGHAPGRGPYGKVVEHALEFVLSCVQPGGYVARDQTRMYEHAFATLAMAEVYGMSHAPELREKLQSAVEYTVKCQNDTGGWRYVPFTVDSDMSVTVCQVVALRAARNVGLKVPQSTIDRALAYVIQSAITEDSYGDNEETGAFFYQPSSTRFNRSSFALSAAGLTTLFQAGLYDNAALAAYIDRRKLRTPPYPTIDATVRYMNDHYREVLSKFRGRHYFYFYGNYYAAQAMYNVGGTDPQKWEDWYNRVRRDLLSLEVRARSGANPDGGGTGGEESYWESNVAPSFSTAVAILILAMPFDYLPIHQR